MTGTDETGGEVDPATPLEEEVPEETGADEDGVPEPETTGGTAAGRVVPVTGAPIGVTDAGGAGLEATGVVGTGVVGTGVVGTGVVGTGVVGTGADDEGRFPFVTEGEVAGPPPNGGRFETGAELTGGNEFTGGTGFPVGGLVVDAGTEGVKAIGCGDCAGAAKAVGVPSVAADPLEMIGGGATGSRFLKLLIF